MVRAFLGTATLWQREIVRFYRQPSRIAGALASPLIFWVLIGSGIGHSFQSQDLSAEKGYLSYFFPGTLLLTLFFTSVFSTISLIEDRKEGFMQSVLIAPVPRFSIVLGKILGGATLAWMQAGLLLCLSPLLGIQLNLWQWGSLLGVLFLNAFLMTSLGFLLAWQFQSIQGFHAVMNLLLMPMWMLSGALFPAQGASPWIQGIMKINPLTYGLAAMRNGLYGQPQEARHLIPAVIFSAAVFAAAVYAAQKNTVKDLK